ncbi:MAG: hypothetical protein ACKO4W_06040 [Bacteroidota bacterium]
MVHPPQVHGNRCIVCQKRLAAGFIGEVNTVVLALNFGSFHDVSEKSLLIYGANSTGNRTVFRQRIAQLVSYHTVLAGGTIAGEEFR